MCQLFTISYIIFLFIWFLSLSLSKKHNNFFSLDLYSCECPDESYKCVRVGDDLSASAYVYRCRQNTTAEDIESPSLDDTLWDEIGISISRHRYLLISHAKSAVTAIVVVVVIVFTIRHITPALRVFDNTSLPYILNESDLHHLFCYKENCDRTIVTCDRAKVILIIYVYCQKLKLLQV